MDVIQNSIAVPNNIGVHELLFKFLSTPFLFCCLLILLQPEPTEYFLGALLLSECDKNQSRIYTSALC